MNELSHHYTLEDGERSANAVAHDPVDERHFHYFGVRVPNPWIAAGVTLAIAGCGLAASAAGQKIGVIGYLGLSGALVLLYPHFALKANLRNWPLWLYPLWTMLSAGWSINPDRTLHSATLLLPTIVAALTVGAMPDRRAVNAGAALALFGYIVTSLVIGHATAFSDGGDASEAFAGVTSGKNYFGHLAAMSLLIGISLFAFAGIRRYGMAIAAIGAVGCAASAFGLVESHATGSTLAVGMGFCVIVAVLLFRRIAWQARIVLLAALAGAAILYAAFGDAIEEQVFAYVLNTFHKDPSLTGRALLWDFADRLIGEKPWLGHGFNAFWFYTNPDAWTLWRSMGVAPMSGFNFHNTPREILIDGGWIGLALFGVPVAYASARAGLRGLLDGDLIAGVRVAFIVYFLMRMAVETTGFAAVTVDTLLLYAFFCVPVKHKVKPIT